MQSNLVSFIQVLRTHDVRVSPAETLDAMDVAAKLGYSDRTRLRDGLGMALAKTPEEEAVFLQCFDRFFQQSLSDFSTDQQPEDEEQAPPEESPEAATGEPSPGNPTGGGGGTSLEMAAEDSAALQSLLETPLMQALMQNDRNALTLAMNQAGEQVGLQGIEMFTQKGQFTRRILDEMGEQHIRDAVIALEREDSPALVELQRYRDILREQVRDYVEREYLLNAEGRQREFMEEVLSKTRLNNIEHMYLHRVHELVRKMARRLASRHARKRRPLKRGQLNMAKTLRRGAATDGILFDVYWRKTRREKPQILALCDVSGSVAAYAKFLLLFL